MYNNTRKYIELKKEECKTIPLVTICCTTYNHDKYIRNAIDGFLNQITNFPFEIIIHDDASSDKTTEIIKEYVSKYPFLIVPIYQSDNRYSKGIKPWSNFVFPKARGKYIALCEGDDYWIDPFKLQSQVDILINDPSLSLVSSNYMIIKLENGLMKSDLNCSSDFRFQLNDLYTQWLVKTPTVVFRKDHLNLVVINSFKFFKDLHLVNHLLLKGDGYFINRPLAVYRIHQNGVHSSASTNQRYLNAYLCFREIFKIEKSDYAANQYVKSAYRLIKYKFIQKSFSEALFVLRKLLSDLLPTSYSKFLFTYK